jgi:uncharacterized protein YjbI with pentapeptide repeats
MTDALVAGTNLTNITVRGFSREQLYSTRSYQTGDLEGIVLNRNLLASWSFRDKNLNRAQFVNSNLTATDFTAASLTDADFTGAVLERTEFNDVTQRGFTAQQLYSTESYQANSLVGIQLQNNDLTGWNLSGQDLTSAAFDFSDLRQVDFSHANLSGANLRQASLVGAHFTGAIIRGANLSASDADQQLTASQLYATQSYRDRDLSGIAFFGLDVQSWDLSGQNLMNTNLTVRSDANTNLKGADLRGAVHHPRLLERTTSGNTIDREGFVAGFVLEDERFWLRDYVPRSNEPDRRIPVRIEQQMTAGDDGLLRLTLDDNGWDSTISFAPSIPVQLGGILQLEFDPAVDVGTQVGREFRLFDWTGVAPIGQFEIASVYAWDTSELYSTGYVILVSVPEPTLWPCIAVLSIIGLRRRATLPWEGRA